ncbi:Carboxymuconolactone decarboxylase family protein [Planctomycetes bacterium Pan216]|uniref:Carboxymuconolactone decarboxylase family protein n=1 Tax=Kolteria novifilia TaxID=2527975 RepID=A0A518B148_9BACT|nr:Carboxymuconolactone decarboxylase family protein [Planctomycetes bacterium Pan216]
MQRLSTVDPAEAQGRTKELLDDAQRAFGMIPNAVKVFAHSPAALDSYLTFTAKMQGGTLDPTLHYLVKLHTSQTNDCDYCTSILCAIGSDTGVSAEEILSGRTGQSDDQRTQAALRFAEAVLEKRGKVSDDELAAVRGAGFGDAEIVEIVASVVHGCLTNFVNNVAGTELDIPRAESIASLAG